MKSKTTIIASITAASIVTIIAVGIKVTHRDNQFMWNGGIETHDDSSYGQDDYSYDTAPDDDAAAPPRK